MKKTLCLLVIFTTLAISAFCDVLIAKNISFDPISRTSEYRTYNVPDWDFPSYVFESASSVLFSLPSVPLPEQSHLNFYLGSSISLNQMYVPGISLTFDAALSYSFHENAWPCMEVLLLSKTGGGVTFIKGTDFYMFTNLAAYFMFMPALGHHGFFFGAGPRIEYQQEANYELYNRFSVGASVIGGVRFRRKV